MSATITAQQVNDLRNRTGAGLMDCKNALLESNGDPDAAAEILRKKGAATRDKKAGRAASEGIVQAYIHTGGKVGVLVEINCESDFVAKNEQFQVFAKQLAMHIAAASPRYVKREEIPAEVVEKEKEIAAAQVTGKPPAAVEKIVQGKLEKFYSEVCLLDQPFVMDSNKKINDLITESITRTGENIVINRFTRYQIGA
ncbi:MAG: translation elongation factor Ts [Puniceicoccales bacterium]|jgi:elongation factor Ts|nr:translation elongation factor Ts [Puniceicoccales bacterium]